MAQAVISKTVLEPTTAEITQFIMTGDFTQGSGINVEVTLNLLNDDLTVNQKDHFAADVVSAMSTIIADVESILGVTFV
jgi:hypothetical protein